MLLSGEGTTYLTPAKLNVSAPFEPLCAPREMKSALPLPEYAVSLSASDESIVVVVLGMTTRAYAPRSTDGERVSNCWCSC
ncbi:hypothetical protein RCH11_001662 [Glaciihabitans sp. GrIS 2.15]|nr:hypothetical protein [Glaciihabitans sp. GrIS 2.15]